ncbi:MAG: pyrroloquinoline quinone-dependent dehydrogenase [Myxococcales bacterium]|nr:pyrroloquinoline quinone-dependent dehydrogenase [Myxococcales bacterium]
MTLALRALLLLQLLWVGCREPSPLDTSGPIADWPAFGGGLDGLRYSPLTQIDPTNVDRLEPVWSHHDPTRLELDPMPATSFQINPIVVGRTLYYCTPFMNVFALDAETGEERWRFEAGLGDVAGSPHPLRCRGVSHWRDPLPEPGRRCNTRIVFGTRAAELIALDAADGRPCDDFGEAGRVSLLDGIAGAGTRDYHPTSAPLVVGDRVIVGTLVFDNQRTDTASGVVRAYDIRSGRLLWSWDPAPTSWRERRGEGEAWVRGSPNVWSSLSADPERGLVFAPTGNPSPDYYGALRDGLDAFGSSTVALDMETGALVWQFQTVHHDLWDYDVPAQPELLEIPGVGAGRPAVLQPTKLGFLFLLDRETGRPLHPVEERPAPTEGAVAGEVLSPTQPWPTHLPPLHPTALEPWGFTPFDRRACAKAFARHRFDGFFTPPSREGSIQFPHSAGGMNWGGVAVDPVRGVAIANQTHVAQAIQLLSREAYAALADVPRQPLEERFPMEGTPWALRRMTLLSPLGAPCNAPPWGSLTAVDLRSGGILWTRPLGTTRDLAPFPLWLELGTPSFGGGIVTASGVYLIGATLDHFLRAFDAATGEEIWRERLPASVNGIPSTYRLDRDGRQLVVAGYGAGLTDADASTAPTLTAWALPWGPEGAMGKLLVLLERVPGDPVSAFRRRVVEDLSPRVAADGRTREVVQYLPIDDASGAEPAVDGMLAIRAPLSAIPALVRDLRRWAGEDLRVHAYRVRERQPRSWQRTWPVGQPSPGVRMIALMVRRPELDPIGFEDDWMERHTRIALSQTLGPLDYSQNVVIERLDADSPAIDGIAMEQFETTDFLARRIQLHPDQYRRGIDSASRFMDFERSRSALMIETVLEVDAPPGR